MNDSKKVLLEKKKICFKRIVNLEKVQILEELIQCSICYELLDNPYECECCGSLFCEECINDWLTINPHCPLKCPNFIISRAKTNTRKMLNLLILRCINYPDCNYQCEYWNIFEHEDKCPYLKRNCPNSPCTFNGNFNLLEKHLINDCNYLRYECGFCKMKINKVDFDKHLDEHYKNQTFYIVSCSNCKSNENLRRCLCKKSYCFKCIESQKNINCIKKCYLFHNNTKFTSEVYNLSKFVLPKNFEAKILFNSVDWVRTGICFGNEILHDQNDQNCPQYDIYCILEDLVQFYTVNSGWKKCFPNNNRKSLRAGDVMTLVLYNNELKYYVNSNDLGSVIKIDLQNKKDMYLFVQTRTNKSRAEILYISEIFN